MSVERLWCKRCLTETEPMLTWQTFSGGTRHLRADCGMCGAYMQYVPQSGTWLEAVTRGAR